MNEREEIEAELEDGWETNCRNCAGAMFWDKDNETWEHNHEWCVDPEPYLGDV